MCSQEQHRVLPQVHLSIESFCALMCPNKCTTTHIFKCNSNAPCFASSNRPQSTPLGVLSDKLSVASSIVLTNAHLSAPSMQCQSAPSTCSVKCVPFGTFLCIFNGSLKWTLKCIFICNI